MPTCGSMGAMELASLAKLDRSHRRQYDVMTELLAAARRLAAGRPEAQDVEAIRSAVGFFERSSARHFLDEEGSVFPRLSTRRPELAEALASLSAEHPPQIALQHALADTAKQLDGGEASARPNVGKQLLEIAEQLEAQHRAHVTREDELFKTAQEALTAEDDAEIVAEMETRRDRDDEANGGGRRHRAKSSTMRAKPQSKRAVTPAAKTAKAAKAKPMRGKAKPMRGKAKPARAKKRR